MYKRLSSAMITVFAVAGLIYVTVVAVMYMLQRDFMYFPNAPKPTRVASGVRDMVEVTFETPDGEELFAWYAAAKVPGKPTVVLFHGNAGTLGDRGYKARLFLDAGYGAMLVEYRGFSGNLGEPTEEGLYNDARGALGYLDSLGVSGRELILYGESLGTGVATKMAAEAAKRGEPVAAVILEAPFTSTADAGAYHYPFLPVHWLMKDRYRSVARIADIDAPLFVVHGEKDTTVPFRLGKRLFAAAREPKDALWLPDASHNDVFEFGAGPAMLAFLDRALSKADVHPDD